MPTEAGWSRADAVPRRRGHVLDEPLRRAGDRRRPPRSTSPCTSSWTPAIGRREPTSGRRCSAPGGDGPGGRGWHDSGRRPPPARRAPLPGVRRGEPELAGRRCIRQARAAARGVRESISSEMWEQLNTLYLSLVDPQRRGGGRGRPARLLPAGARGRSVLPGPGRRHAGARRGLALRLAWASTWSGPTTWRGCSTLQSHLLLRGRDRAGRRRHGALAGRAALVRLGRGLRALLLAAGRAGAGDRVPAAQPDVFPQSVRFSLERRLGARCRPSPSRGAACGEPDTRAVRALGLLRARLEHAAVDEVLEEGLAGFLARRAASASRWCPSTSPRSYLRDEPQAGPAWWPSRARR